ncbi:MAG: hypothetical protein QXZ20_00275 [Candidatus Aenigmatarchaeota archaeon]
MRKIMSLLIKLSNKNIEIKEKFFISLTIILSLTLVILFSDCVKNDISKSHGLEINLDFPENVRNKQEFSVFLELSNKGKQDYKISVDFFDVGLFKKKSECKKEFDLKSGFDQFIECKLVFESEKELKKSIEETIHSLIRYNTQFYMVKELVALTQDEYENRRITRRLEELPKVFVENNGDLEVTLELSENPIVARDIESYLYIKIKNIGNGFANDLKKGDIEINIIPNIPITCDIDEKISIEKGAGIIPCKIEVKSLKESYLNIYIIINIKYEYEIKKSAKIRILK